MNVSSGKAGRTRWQGRRPHVRGMVMNPIDHPMGGGQGKSKGGGGRHHPVSPWGQFAKGFKTRAQAQAERSLHRRSAVDEEEVICFMGRSLKKGPFVEPHLLEKIDKMNDVGREEADQDLVAPLDGDAGFRRPHLPGPQRQNFSIPSS